LPKYADAMIEPAISLSGDAFDGDAIYSLLGSVKLNGIDPLHILAQIADHSLSKIDKLHP
jgi:hypothetical protein